MQLHSSYIVSEAPGEDTSADDIFPIYHLSIQKHTPLITIFITIIDQQVPIEVETGASTSIINWDTFLELKRKSCLNLSLTVIKLRTYFG